MAQQSTFLVLGATGGTGKHFVAQALADGNRVRALVRSPGTAQHQDNEALIACLATEANDIEWIVHRAGIGSDGPSKGVLKRSTTKLSIATHLDCATYNYRTIRDASAVHTADLSHYAGS